jgi:hypothetical protein
MGAVSLRGAAQTKFNLTHHRISNLTTTANPAGWGQRKRDVQRSQMVSPRSAVAWPVRDFPVDADTHRKIQQKT